MGEIFSLSRNGLTFDITAQLWGKRPQKWACEDATS